jgi:histidyl-tRNA synthetase
LSTAPIEEVSAAIDLLRAHGSPSPEADIEVDLSLARGLRYYTGLVFEIHVEDQDGPLQVCGGGRYDDLVRALGGRESVPACGFSFGLERVALAAAKESASKRSILVVGVTPEDHRDAIEVAGALRGLPNVVVEQDVRLRGVKSALRYADRAQLDLVIILGQRERDEGVVVLRDMRTREENRVPLGELEVAVQRALD